MDFAQLSGAGRIKLSSTPKSITPFAGLASFIVWLRQIGFYRQAAQLMPFSYASPNAISLADTLCAFLFSVILGASSFAHCDWLRFDSALMPCWASRASRPPMPSCVSSGASPRGALRRFSAP